MQLQQHDTQAARCKSRNTMLHNACNTMMNKACNTHAASIINACLTCFSSLLQRQRGMSAMYLKGISRHTSHVTRHTSHVKGHTSQVSRHTSHVKGHTSHVTHHTSHVPRHASHITRHKSQVTRYTSHVTRHTSRLDAAQPPTGPPPPSPPNSCACHAQRKTAESPGAHVTMRHVSRDIGWGRGVVT